MKQEWYCDSCDCKIIVNENFQWVDTIQKCRLHKSFNGQNWVNQVLAQNNRFNGIFGNIVLTQEQKNEINLAKLINQRRIRQENLDNFHEHLPVEHTRTFFENLKRLLGRLNPL